jgi:DedD protein
MDSRAKQRLTGAVILVALFVLLVPELLPPPKDTAGVPGTDAEEGMRRYTIDLDAPAPTGGQAVEPVVVLPPVTGAPAAGAASERAQPGEAAMPAPVEAPAMQAASPPAANTTATQDALKPAPAAGAQRAPSTPAAPTNAQAPSRADTRGPAAAGTEPRSFVVQLGSFGQKENAEKLVRDMTAKGFATFIAPITTNGRELYRVRVGPTRDRASAEALAAQLKRMGQSGSIVPIP